MSLIDDYKEHCVLLERKSVPDGEGGVHTTWTEGMAFSAAIMQSSAIENRIAEKQNLAIRYTVMVSKSVVLQYDDVFKRLKDGKIFRVTSNSEDVQTPKRASFQASQVTAEEWRQA